MTLREGHRDLPAEAPTKDNRIRQPDREGKSSGHVRQRREGKWGRRSPGVPGPGKVENGYAGRCGKGLREALEQAFLDRAGRQRDQETPARKLPGGLSHT